VGKTLEELNKKYNWEKWDKISKDQIWVGVENALFFAFNQR